MSDMLWWLVPSGAVMCAVVLFTILSTIGSAKQHSQPARAAVKKVAVSVIATSKEVSCASADRIKGSVIANVQWWTVE